MAILTKSIANFRTLCRTNKLFAILSFFCLVTAFLSFLFLVEKGYNSFLFELDRSYLYLESNDTDSIISIYEKVSSNDSLPDIRSISLFDENCTGIFFDAKYFGLYIAHGRLFTSEELSSGDHVAILSTEYIRRLEKDKIDSIWSDGIAITDIRYQTVGSYTDIARYFSPEDLAQVYPIPTLIAIPLTTYLSTGHTPTMLNCSFSQPLNNRQLEILKDIILSYKTIHRYTLPSIRDSALSSLLGALSQYVIVLILALIGVVSVLLYWLSMEFHRYRIYLLCGAKRKHIIFLLSMNVLLLDTMAYATSLVILFLITNNAPSGLVSFLPAIAYVIIYFGVVLFTLLIVNLRSLKLWRIKKYISLS